ncbi:MAG: sigma-70 family RNA polymerase sigma factor [Kofleriaceae bacterium]
MATAEDLAETFTAGWAASPGTRVAANVGERLEQLCREATTAHPALSIDPRELVTAIAARAPASELDGYLLRCRAPDLALAQLAARGAADAIAEIERAFRATIEATCRRFAGPGHTPDDLKQILRERLFVAEPGKQPKINEYAGQGFLENWLRVTAVRVFLDLGKRKDRHREAPADDDDVHALAEPGDLALDVVKAEYRSAVAAAMRDAARLLEPGDRHLLRQHMVAGLSIDQLGAVLGIHRATAARRIAKAREQLVEHTRRLLAERLKIDDAELDEVLGLVISRLDVSISSLLKTMREAP